MSEKHPIVAATGSSGAGTSTVQAAFSRIFTQMGIKPAVIEGDAFHAYDREGMQEEIQKALIRSENFSHFGAAANHFDRLEQLFAQYSQSGSGECRHYLHSEEDAQAYGQKAGTFTEWESLPPDTDLLFYEGLHAGVVTYDVDIAQHVDLLIGVVPTINLEWTQKIWRDTVQRGYSSEAVQQNILRRMHDYVHFIVPQFSRTDVNFQRVPTVDTSNPFAVQEIPGAEESFVVIRFRDARKLLVDFPWLLSMLHDSFMSAPDTLVVPGGRMGMAMELIFTPWIERATKRRRALIRHQRRSLPPELEQLQQQQ